MKTLKKYRGPLELLLCSFIWGTAFIFQKVGLQYVGNFTLNCVRMALASLFLLPVVVVRRRRAKRAGEAQPLKTLILAGLSCGAVLFIAANLQQAAIKVSTPGKVGFITALYVVLVPLIGLLFFKRKVRFNVWIGAALAVVGLYLLCVKDSFEIGAGELLSLGSALFFALQITLVGIYSQKTDPVALCMLQFVMVSVLSLGPMLVFEQPRMSDILNAGVPILYAGVVSCGFGYTLQALGQRETDPSVASIIMCLEALFAFVAEIIYFDRVPAVSEFVGSAVMLTAIIVAELDLSRIGARKRIRKAR